jgi:DNA polymerase V
MTSVAASANKRGIPVPFVLYLFLIWGSRAWGRAMLYPVALDPDHLSLVPMTADSCRLITAALRCVEAAWRDGRGCRYVKAGVLLADLCPASAAPLDLFAAASPRRAALMAVMDQVNARYGWNTLFPAAAGVEHRWETRAAHRSPRYTTRLDELPRVRA